MPLHIKVINQRGDEVPGEIRQTGPGDWTVNVGPVYVPVYYRTTEELDKLPDAAVIYDGNNQVWQKGNVGIECGWLAPGRDQVWQSFEIELPARLLDDGL